MGGCTWHGVAVPPGEGSKREVGGGVAKRVFLALLRLNLWAGWCAQLYGLVWSGPAGHFWQQLVERIFGPKKDPPTLLKKVLGGPSIASPMTETSLEVGETES